MLAHISGLFRYPIKGLSCEPLPSVPLQPGRGVPGDCAFTLALPANLFESPRVSQRVPCVSHATVA